MSELRSDLRYLSTHEWARVEDDGTVTVGITDHAQDALGDVVYAETPELGSEVLAGQESGVVESVKAASDIFSPVSGEVIAVNDALEETPEIINESPYDDGWFFKVRPSELGELENALDAEGYQAMIGDE